MVSIANPLYFFAAPSSSTVSTQSSTIRITDVIEYFFVAHFDSNRKEGEESKRVLYFYPKNEIIDRQIDITGFAEAVVNFTNDLAGSGTPKGTSEFPHRTVSTQKAEHVYVQVEDEQFLLGVALCKESCQVANYSIFVPALRNVLIDSYKMFRLFFGTMTLFKKHNEEKFRERLEYFFGRYLALLKLHKMPLLDYLGGAEFLPLQGEIYLDIVTMLSEVEEEFPQIKKLVFIYQDKLLYYSISSRDIPSLFRYLTQNLLPGSLASELEPNQKRSPGRFLRGPEDLSLDTPLVGDEALPTVYLNSKDDQEEEEKLQRYQMIVYRCLNATVCMFVQSEVTRRLMRNVDSFLGPELAKVASSIGESVGSADSAALRSSCDFHYIYFNPASLSMTSSFSETQLLDDAITGVVKPPSPPTDVNRLVCETLLRFIDEKEEFGECFVKSESEWWIVLKKVNCRLLCLLLPPCVNQPSLADIQTKAQSIIKNRFEAIFFN